MVGLEEETSTVGETMAGGETATTGGEAATAVGANRPAKRTDTAADTTK